MEAASVRLQWPNRGLDENFGFHQQRELTTPSAQNVRALDPKTGRTRGAQRSGLSKYLSSQLANSPVQDIGHLVVSKAASGAADASVRTITNYAVVNGTVYTFTDSASATPTDGSSALSGSVPVIFSAPLFGQVFFADGTNAKYYDTSDSTVYTWAATAGELPVNGSNRPRLIELWRSRIVMSGLVGDGHNWFMSHVGDAFDWDYDPDITCETQAVAGNNSDAGKVGDVVNTLIPFNDDILIFGCDSSIWQLSGDPMSGGRIDRVSDVTGMAFGRPWCKDPSGVLYFFGSRGGVYKLVPGSIPERISQYAIDERLLDVDLSTRIVRMAWNDREHGIHIFISPTSSASTTHYFYDVKNDGWWPDIFANNNHNPLAIHMLDGDDPDDRVLILGSRDGYLLKWDSEAENDDATAIDSYVKLPILPGTLIEGSLREMQGVLASGSSDVNWDLYRGDSPEEAASQTVAFSSGKWKAGRNRSVRQKCRGDAMYLRLRNNTSGETWAYEYVDLRIAQAGKTSQRVT